jgi:hypothetical protein
MFVMSSEALYVDSKKLSVILDIDERVIRELAAAELLPCKDFGTKKKRKDFGTQKNRKRSIWRFPRERIVKIAQKIPKTPLEEYEVENTLIVWFKVNSNAPVGFAATLNKKLRSFLDHKGVYEHYASHEITPHEPERSYRKLDGKRIVDNSARSGTGKRYDQQ